MLRRVALAILALLAAPAVGAQNLRQQVQQLFTFGSCGEIICLSPNVIGQHGEHFKPAAQRDGLAFIGFLSSSIGFSVANTPISSATSGTTFRLVGGVPVKTSTSAGPILAERAQTLGRGQFYAGLGITQMNFERLRGVPLNHITFNFTHEDVDEAGVGGIDTLGLPSFEHDYIGVKVGMDVSLLVTSFSLTYGLVDGVDVGVTVPFVRVGVHGNSEAQIVSTSGTIWHFFSGTPTNPVVTAVSSADGRASGLGDVEGHLKINLAQSDRIGVALFGSARFPTGDTLNLLGAGGLSARGLGIVSARFGQFDPHVNIGYTVRDARDQNNSMDVALGYDALLAPWATMAFDLLGSWQMGASKVQPPPAVVYQYPVVTTLDVTNIPAQRDDFMSLNVGFKFTTPRGIQIVTNALFPLRNSGLQPSVAWTAGLGYNF